MRLDFSRDFLDGILLQHPQPGSDGKNDVKVNAGVQFLPSSPDGKLHTAIVTFTLHMEGAQQPFARGGWRFLFTSDEPFKPQENGSHPFVKQMLSMGITKITTVLNPLCLHANMPVLPVDANRMIQSAEIQQQQKQAGGEGGATAGDANPPMP